MTSTATAARDYSAEYVAARVIAHTAPTMTEQQAGRSLSDKIRRAADKSGVWLDEIALDNQARVTANGGAPLTTR